MELTDQLTWQPPVGFLTTGFSFDPQTASLKPQAQPLHLHPFWFNCFLLLGQLKLRTVKKTLSWCKVIQEHSTKLLQQQSVLHNMMSNTQSPPAGWRFCSSAKKPSDKTNRSATSGLTWLHTSPHPPTTMDSFWTRLRAVNTHGLQRCVWFKNNKDKTVFGWFLRCRKNKRIQMILVWGNHSGKVAEIVGIFLQKSTKSQLKLSWMISAWLLVQSLLVLYLSISLHTGTLLQPTLTHVATWISPLGD